MKEIIAVTEAYSMQPCTWRIGQEIVTHDSDVIKGPVNTVKITEIKRGVLYDTGDAYDTYDIYAGKQLVAQVRVNSANVQYKLTRSDER